jgi:hypothetical protein
LVTCRHWHCHIRRSNFLIQNKKNQRTAKPVFCRVLAWRVPAPFQLPEQYKSASKPADQVSKGFDERPCKLRCSPAFAAQQWPFQGLQSSFTVSARELASNRTHSCNWNNVPRTIGPSATPFTDLRYRLQTKRSFPPFTVFLGCSNFEATPWCRV